MDYINGQKLTVKESDIGFDLNGDGDTKDKIALTIEYDADAHAETNGYYGTYLDLYLAEFTESLNNYLAGLDYADGWTWFDSNGKAMSDSTVAKMTNADKAKAFIEGRYAKGSSTGSNEGMPGGGEMPGGTAPDGNMPGDLGNGEKPDGDPPGDLGGNAPDNTGNTEEVGTPDAGTTQAAGSGTDSSNYASFADMLSAYQSDIAQVQAGDSYGNNIVELYNPINYIGAEDTSDPVWTRVLMGASEGDISMFNSLNMEIAWLNAGTDAVIEWQWDGGHVPSEIFDDSLPLYVDMMYGKHVDGATEVTKPAATPQKSNGTADSATGTDISSWVSYRSDAGASFSLAKAAAYRTAGASKAMPGFDVMDYGQEDYVFGSSTADARHWDKYVLKIFEENSDTLEPLFNASK